MINFYGYIRVSSKDQNEDRQMASLSKYNIPLNNIFHDIQSGKDFDRPSYIKMLSVLKKDDVLIIKSIDRLGRNYSEIIEQWRKLTKEIGIDIIVVDMPILDTRLNKDLLGTFISDIFLQVLSFVAENERANIRQRQAEGIAAAKARGVRFGRPEIQLNDKQLKIIKLYKEGRLSASEAARRCYLSISTFLYKAKKIKY